MEFTLHTFLFLFLPVILTGYLLLNRWANQKVLNGYLLIISLLLYIWVSLQFFFWFLVIILLTYILGNVVSGAKENIQEKKKWTTMAVSIFIFLLGYYKYYTFILENLNMAGWLKGEMEAIAVPIGISFLIFEAISYVVDIARGNATTGNLFDVALYLAFFPKLASGPIILWKHFQPQINARKSDITIVTDGIDRIIIGYAKKAIIADTLGLAVAQIQSMSVTGIDRNTYFIRAFLYMLEIYFDFSGYSDIAIGICNFFGFSVDKNFNYPYVSASITEFWRRWHISLGTWFREYVYIPLGGNRRGNVYLNLFIVFLLTGIWHGANWTFLVWGGINGIFVMLERYAQKKLWYQKIPRMIKWMTTMLLVYFMWIMFMAVDISEAIDTYRHFLGMTLEETVNFTYKYFMTYKTGYIALIGGILAVLGANRHVKVIYNSLLSWQIGRYRVGYMMKSLLLLALFAMIILFVVNSSYSPFLYFQF